MSISFERDKHLLQREISNIIQSNMNDERLKLVTITNLKLTKDKSIAKVYFRHNDGDKNEIHLKSLENASGFIKNELAHRLNMRKIPELKFYYDDSLDYGNKIESMLNNLK